VNSLAVRQGSIRLFFPLRSCEAGEILRNQSGCLLCVAGTYSLSTSDLTCRECPNHAECLGGAALYPDPGYWRAEDSDQIITCPNPDACPGLPSNSSSPSAGCAPNYTGNVCQPCAPGYSHTDRNTCAPCPYTSSNAWWLGGYTIAFFLILISVVAIIFHTCDTESSVEMKTLKISVNLMLMLGCVSSELWPDSFRSVFSTVRYLGSPLKQSFSLDCLLESEELPLPNYFFRGLLLQALMPLGLILLALLLLAGLAAIFRNTKYFVQYCLGTLVVVYFFTLSSVLSPLLSSLSCQEVQRGALWLSADLRIRCWQGDHLHYVLCVTVPALIVWGLLVPLACLLRITKDFGHDTDFKRHYSFLTSAYKKEYYRWDFLLLLRQFLCVFLSEFGYFKPLVQTLCLQLVLLCSLAIQWHYKPFSLGEESQYSSVHQSGQSETDRSELPPNASPVPIPQPNQSESERIRPAPIYLDSSGSISSPNLSQSPTVPEGLSPPLPTTYREAASGKHPSNELELLSLLVVNIANYGVLYIQTNGVGSGFPVVLLVFVLIGIGGFGVLMAISCREVPMKVKKWLRDSRFWRWFKSLFPLSNKRNHSSSLR